MYNYDTIIKQLEVMTPAHQDEFAQKLINEKDGENSVTRDVKKEILELGFPQQFPKN